ncbi:MAG TPA: ferrochelatase [Longimicrobiaceae bacterium]|nr:ferrochelatase [Longimicrobiaceae bacterium]
MQATKTGIILLNFGEPEHATLNEVVPFLEKIFSLNSPLMGGATVEEVRERSRKMAEVRAPGLIEEYEAIGGSPLHAQAREQAEGLERELKRRGHDAVVRLGMQFTEPTIMEAVETMRAEGVEVLVGLPAYPLAGPSTTVAALEAMDAAVKALQWDVSVREVSGWHLHPAYLALRAESIRATAEKGGVSLDEPGTRLVFSAHGTPVKYLQAGNGYEMYVRDYCDRVAALLGVRDYELGYQNHTNRPGLQWTQPDIEQVIATTTAERVVVDACSFMHEQSETLAELDHGLRGEAEGRGLEFHRVPVPYAAPRFISVLADLVEPFTRPGGGPVVGEAPVEVAGVAMRPCLCKRSPRAFCMNPVLHEG